MSVAVVCSLQLEWIISLAGIVALLMFAAGRSTRVAGIGRAVEYSWTVVSGS